MDPAPLGFPFERVSGSQFRAGSRRLPCGYALPRWFTSRLQNGEIPFERFDLYPGNGANDAHCRDAASRLGDGRYLESAGHRCLRRKLGSRFDQCDAFATIDLYRRLPGFFCYRPSWGTFALLFPLALPAAVTVDASLALSVAVLSGGLFGDHASPISETTLLASAGAAVDPIDHFRTQLPYALCNGSLCLLGLWIAGLSQWQGVLLGVLSLQLAVLLAARWLWRRKAQRDI